MKANKLMKQVERNAAGVFYKLANGVQFNIMNLEKVIGPVRKVLMEGGTLAQAEAALLITIAQYREN